MPTNAPQVRRQRTLKQAPRHRKPLRGLPLTLTSRIPLEIVEAIIGCLHEDDSSSATSLSLVSRTWLHSSRVFTFRYLKIVEEDVAALEALLASQFCTIKEHVTGIIALGAEEQDEKRESRELAPSSDNYPHTASLLSSLQFQRADLDARCLLWCINENTITLSLGTTFSPDFTPLTTLTLQSSKFECITELAAVLEGLPMLQHLALIHVHWCRLGPYDVRPAPSFKLVDRLKTLRMRSMSVDDLVEWLLLDGRTLELAELDLGMAERKVCIDVCRAIRGETLRSLSIHGFPDGYDVAKFSNLEFISITIRAQDNCEPALKVLKRLTSPRLTTIHYDVHTRFFSNSFFDASSMFFDAVRDWRELEDALRDDRFRCLTTLEFSFDRGHKKMATRLAENLPTLHKQGMLFVSRSPSYSG